ncbi:MAG TPA: hypothetical protein VJI74_03075 [Candidatus Paceibacterota bacterium]
MEDYTPIWTLSDFWDAVKARLLKGQPCEPARFSIVSRSGGSIGIRAAEKTEEAEKLLSIAFSLHLFPAPVCVRWPVLVPVSPESIRVARREKERLNDFLERILEKDLREYAKRAEALPSLALTLPNGIEQLRLFTHSHSPGMYESMITRSLERSPTNEVFLTPYSPVTKK